MQPTQILFVVLVVLLIVAIRLLKGRVDRINIIRAGTARGWKDISITWSPFAPGAFAEKGERHYFVSFTDSEGNTKSKYCKTGWLTGVFWRD